MNACQLVTEWGLFSSYFARYVFFLYFLGYLGPSIHFVFFSAKKKHSLTVIRKPVHGVRLAHEDGWVAHGAAMRQPGEDQA